MKPTAILLLLLPLSAAAQDVPTFRAGVAPVLVDVLALDSDGEPIADLQASELEILEDGVPQTIATFDATDWTSYVAAREGAAGAEDAAAGNTYPRRFVFVYNRQGAKFEWLARAKRALAEFVVESMAEGDEAMVAEVGFSFKVVQELESGKETTLQTVRDLSQMRLAYPMGADRASGQLYRDLEELAERLQEIPGRKVMVVLSNQLPTFTGAGSRRSNEAFTLKRAVDALNQANVTVYTIDLRGPESTLSISDGLSPLATETGGRYFRTAIAFETPLRRIGRENSRYYLASYVSTRPEQDGTYRTLEVRTTRPGVELIARRGYFAREAEAPRGGETEDEDAAEAAAEEDVASASIGLPQAVEMTSYVLPNGDGSARVPLAVALPGNLLADEPRRLEVQIVKDESTVASFAADVDRERYYLVESARLEPGGYLMRIRLRDGSESLYEASTAIQVPTDYGAQFGLSSIVPVVAPQDAPSVGDHLPVLPTTILSRGDDAFLLFQVFAGRERRAERAHLTFRILDANGDEVGSGGNNGPMELPSGVEGTPVVLRIPMAELSRGDYIVDVRVEDRSRGRRAGSEIELRVR